MRFLLAVLTLVIAGCTSKNNSALTAVELKATMTGAVSLAMKRDSVTNQYSGRTLKKIAVNGELTDVFSNEANVGSFVVTATHVVVGGSFYNLKTAEGGSINCGFLAFTKNAIVEDVKCLSELMPYIYEGSPRSYLATDGTNVYFTGFWPSDNSRAKLMKWDGTSSSSTAILELGVAGSSLGFTHIFLSNNGQNICALQQSVTYITCGSVSGQGFANIAIPSQPGSQVLRVGKSVLFSNSSLNLDTLTLTTLPSYLALPLYPRHVASISTSETVAIGFSCNFCVVKFDEDGNETTIDSSVQWDQIVRDGNFIYAYSAAGSMLKRMAIGDTSFAPANYLSSYGMLTVDLMSFTMEGTNSFIRIDGTNNSGQIARAYIDVDTAALHSATSELPALEHVIDL